MSRFSLVLLSVCAGLAFSLLPVAVDEVLFARAGLQHAQEALQQLTDKAAERAQHISRQVDKVFREMESIKSEACSPQFLEAVRRLTFNSAYIKDIGTLHDGKLACSAVLGDVRRTGNLVLGKPDFVDSGYSVWYQDASPDGTWRENLLIGRGTWYASIGPGSFVYLPDAKNYAIAAINIDSGFVIANSNPFARDALSEYWRRSVIDDAEHLYATALRSGLRVVIVGRTSRPRYHFSLERMLPTWFTVGTVTGAAAGAAVFLLLSRLLFSKRRRLVRAIRQRKLSVHYQPIMSLESGRCAGVEALARWNDGGVQIPPDEFIQLAERAGVITDLTRLVLDTALADLAEIFSANADFYCSINLSTRDLDPAGFLTYLQGAMRKHNLEPGRIRVEILERDLLDIASVQHAIKAFRDAGHEVYLDDFGTGYSSLAYLQDLKLDVLKIAKPFVDAIGKNAPTSLVAPHIIALAQALGLQLIAEGVETLEQLAFLKERQVPLVQGWLFSKAIPAEQLKAFFSKLQEGPMKDTGPAVPAAR